MRGGSDFYQRIESGALEVNGFVTADGGSVILAAVLAEHSLAEGGTVPCDTDAIGPLVVA